MSIVADPENIRFVISDRYSDGDSGLFAVAAARLHEIDRWQPIIFYASGEARWRIPIHAACLTRQVDLKAVGPNDPVFFDADGFRSYADIRDRYDIQDAALTQVAEMADEASIHRKFTAGNPDHEATRRGIAYALQAVIALEEAIGVDQPALDAQNGHESTADAQAEAA
jgi:hypothetical protein